MSDNIIQLNEDLIKNDLRSLVRSSVEIQKEFFETLSSIQDNAVYQALAEYGKRAIRSALRRELRSIGKEFENGIRN